MVTLGWAPAAPGFAGLQERAWTLLAWAVRAGQRGAAPAVLQRAAARLPVSDLTVVYPVARGSAPLLSVLGAALVAG
jgi:hypothetical protein